MHPCKSGAWETEGRDHKFKSHQFIGAGCKYHYGRAKQGDGWISGPTLVTLHLYNLGTIIIPKSTKVVDKSELGRQLKSENVNVACTQKTCCQSRN